MGTGDDVRDCGGGVETTLETYQLGTRDDVGDLGDWGVETNWCHNRCGMEATLETQRLGSGEDTEVLEAG